MDHVPALSAADVPQALRAAAGILAKGGVASPETDASALLAHAWGIEVRELSRRRLFAEAVPAAVLTDFAELIARRGTRVPLQHLTGSAAFRRLDLLVGPGVFVPRPETELLVTELLAELERLDERLDRDGDSAPFVIDLCSGSGAIALSVAHEHPRVRVLGIEREPAALEWSLRNRERVAVGASTVDFVRGDATAVVGDRPDLRSSADVVVTNPPYVPDDARPREPEVADHDPAAALYGGAGGLEIPALIIDQAEKLLRPGGLLLMEHGEEQGAGVRELIAATASLRGARTAQDYTGRDRFTVARRTGDDR
ncbi:MULTISPECIES: peptide chain release factor N(5)-glutamine methyltransferase [Brevibacterium]|nr:MULTISPECIES: peptide chain release factor N(5)-glutamine methyltransferase [Brevibacterium]